MSEFVNFKMSMKLKEKGFPQHMCDDGYITEEDDKYDIGDKEMIWLIPDYLPYIAAPIVSQVLKWLREEKKLFVEVYMYNSHYLWEIYNTEIIDVDLTQKSEKYSEEEFQTYEKAALAGIEYVLDNLI